MANTSVINLRKGHAVRHNNDVCIITEMEHKKPPRMASYVQMSIKSITNGKVSNLRLTSNESLDSVNLNKDAHDYSYQDGDGYHFTQLLLRNKGYPERQSHVCPNADKEDR